MVAMHHCTISLQTAALHFPPCCRAGTEGDYCYNVRNPCTVRPSKVSHFTSHLQDRTRDSSRRSLTLTSPCKSTLQTAQTRSAPAARQGA